MVGSSEDLEIAVIAPIGVPRIGDKPVRRTVFFAPTQDPDGVSAQEFAGYMLVHAYNNNDIIKETAWTNGEKKIKLTVNDDWLLLYKNSETSLTGFILQEVLVDLEGAFYWSVVEYLPSDKLFVTLYRVGFLT